MNLVENFNHILIVDSSTPAYLFNTGYAPAKTINRFTDKVIVSFEALSKSTGTPLIDAEHLDEAIKQLSKDLYAAHGRKMVIRVVICLDNDYGNGDNAMYGVDPVLTPAIISRTNYPVINMHYNRTELTMCGKTTTSFNLVPGEHPIVTLMRGVREIKPNCNIAIEGTPNNSFGAERGYSEEIKKQIKAFDPTLLSLGMENIDQHRFKEYVRGRELAVINEQSLSGFFFNSQEEFSVGQLTGA